MNKIKELSERIIKQQKSVSTEEATKIAFILPFLQILGYDIFDPEEVIPEYTADYGVKKGEKVDFAISIDKHINIIIECKSINSTLDYKHASQLFRYFSVTDSKFGIITNGITYLFFTDSEKTNIMDPEPFFEFNILKFSQNDLDILSNFSRWNINKEINMLINNKIIFKEKHKIIEEAVLIENESSESLLSIEFNLLCDHLENESIEIYLLSKYSLKEEYNDIIKNIGIELSFKFISNYSLLFLYKTFIDENTKLSERELYKIFEKKLGKSLVKNINGTNKRGRLILI